MKLHLDGRTVLVTGGTKGIGRSIVETFLEEGANVAYCARSVSGIEFASQCESSGCKAIGTALDVSDKAAIGAWVSQTAQLFGGIDVVVSNVSALAIPNTEECWTQSFQVDMLGPFHLINASLPHLESSPVRAIISIGSVSGHEIDFTTPGPYGAFKAASTHYMQSLAYKLAPKGIRVNTVSPGNTMFENGFWERSKHDDPEFFQAALALNPTGRMCTPKEIANAVVFLASPVSSFTTGANLIVDGALTKGVKV